MKTRIIITLALSAMIFLGCSRESLDDPTNDSKDFEMNLESPDTKKGKKLLKIKMKGFGDMKMVKPQFCDELEQIEMAGESIEMTFGQFKTKITNCTNFNDQNNMKGMHTASNGDQLFFYSDEFVVENNIKYHKIVIYGGSGQFQGASGMMKLSLEDTFNDQISGTYSYYAEGQLSY